MSIANRLVELGIVLPDSVPPLALYRPAVQFNDLVYVSGQLAIRDGETIYPGRLGAEVTVEQGQESARVALINSLAAIHNLLGTLEGIRILRLTGYVACTVEFHDQPAVINGASELLRDIIGEQLGVGSRLALGVTALPTNSPVEIELIIGINA